MNALARIATIAGNTVREAVRSRLLYSLLFFAVLLMLAGIFLASLSYVERDRVLQNLAFAATRVFGVAIAVFVGVNLIHREVDRRTVFTILSKPLTRAEFLLGKFAGLTLAVWMQLGVMVATFGLVSVLTGAPFSATHAAALLLLAVELALMVAVATLFSAFTTPMLASFFSSALWVVGQLTRDLRDIGAQSSDALVVHGSRALFWLLPDLESFDLTLEAVHRLPITAADVWLPLVYGAGYAILLLLLAVAIFERRDFR